MTLTETAKALVRAKIATIFISPRESIGRIEVKPEGRLFMVLGDDASIADFMKRCKPHNPDGTMSLGVRL